MARYELLNNVAHKDLRVITHFGRELGDQVAVLPAFPSEYAELQREYPIFFRKQRDSGDWQSVALLGFERDENLFLQGSHWNASYLPGAIAKGPFLIGFQEQQIDGELRQEPVIHVDLDHPRVSFSEGEAVFTTQGGHSAYLQHVITVLRGIRDGTEMTQPMTAALERCGLLQPFAIDVQLDEAHRVNVAGLFGIDRDRLAGLDAKSLHRLHQAGYLEGVYLMLASMHNVRRLMAEKQRRLRQAVAETAEHATKKDATKKQATGERAS